MPGSLSYLAPFALCLALVSPAYTEETDPEKLVEAGTLAMQQWDQDPMRGVEATINLIKALRNLQQTRRI